MFFKPFLSKARIYLDYASSTPLDHKMLAGFSSVPKSYAGANPSALHQEGVGLKKVLSQARSLVASTLGANKEEVIFTSSATESDNLAVLGFVNYFLKQGIAPEKIAIYTSPFEHAAINETLKNLNSKIRICQLVQENGYVLTKTITIPEEVSVVLISVMYIQNEIGTVQPIKEIAKKVRQLRKESPNKTIVFHCDATQAPLFYDLNVARLGVDMMTLGATKLYCPKGVGLLYKKHNLRISPIIFGGGQEMGLRPGTEPVELINTFAQSIYYAQNNIELASAKILSLKKYLESKIEKYLPAVRINSEGEQTPHILYLVVPKIDSELLVLELDARGIAVSSKSACKNEDGSDSELLSILYPNENLGAIRVSFGRMTTKKDLDKFVKALDSVIEKYSL